MKTVFRITLFFGLVSMIVFSTVSCSKDKVEVVNEVFDSTGFVRLTDIRTFQSDAHTTTGELVIYGNGTKIVYMFRNFKTQDADNLDVLLANDINNVISGGNLNLGDLKGAEGNFYYEAANSTASFSYLVIWDADASTKFGHAFTI